MLVAFYIVFVFIVCVFVIRTYISYTHDAGDVWNVYDADKKPESI